MLKQSVSDYETNGLFVDMDPHSLVPPCCEVGVGAMSDFQRISASLMALKRSILFWENELEPSSFVLAIIHSGCWLPFIRFLSIGVYAKPSVCLKEPCICFLCHWIIGAKQLCACV